MIIKRVSVILLAFAMLLITLCACGSGENAAADSLIPGSSQNTVQDSEVQMSDQTATNDIAENAETNYLSDSTEATETEIITAAANVTSDGVLDASDFFTDRDLVQTPDLSEAVSYEVTDSTDIRITAEGVYVLSGTAEDVTVYVEADSEAKVQLVLDHLNLTNSDFPCIYVIEADKVFVTTSADSALSVSGTFTADGETNTDGVIFCRSDLVLNGTAALTISSADNAVVCKDDLKITGGTYMVTAASVAFKANDSIRICDGNVTITSGTDGLHSENSDDDSLGFIYICGGTFTIDAGDDAIHGISVVQIDDGTFDINAAEAIEGTYVQINGGTINIQSSDDAINAGQKSAAYSAVLEINGGVITIVMGNGDTDGLDSNGNLYINGGTVDISGNSACDYDGIAEFNGGTLIINGEEVTEIPNQMMGGMGGMGAFGGIGG